MNLIRKFIILSFMPIIYSNFNNFVNNSNIIYATEEIKNSELKLKSESKSGVSFEIFDNYNSDSEKINIKICALSEKDIKLENLEIEIIFDKRIFRFIKKYFEFSDNFKTKLENIDENTKILRISIKNKENINLYKNLNSEILNFDLNIKKKIPAYESDIKICIKLDDNKYEENKHVEILNKNQNDEENKTKLKKTDSNANIKSENHGLEVSQNEKKKSKSKNKTKKSKKIKKNKTVEEKIKYKKDKSNRKNKKSDSKSKPKSKPEDIECIDEVTNEECNIDAKYNRNSEDSDSIKIKTEPKLEHEELINNNNNNKINLNIIKISVIIILVLILVLTWLFYKKSKNKNNNKNNDN